MENIMKMKNKIFKAVFNIVETIILILIGKSIKLETVQIVVAMCSFLITRLLISAVFKGKPLHYKKWYRCFVWSSLVLASIYRVCKIGFFPSVLLSAFAALVSSGLVDIEDCYMWSPRWK